MHFNALVLIEYSIQSVQTRFLNKFISLLDGYGKSENRIIRGFNSWIIFFCAYSVVNKAVDAHSISVWSEDHSFLHETVSASSQV